MSSCDWVGAREDDARERVRSRLVEGHEMNVSSPDTLAQSVNFTNKKV